MSVRFKKLGDFYFETPTFSAEGTERPYSGWFSEEQKLKSSNPIQHWLITSRCSLLQMCNYFSHLLPLHCFILMV